MKSSELTMTKTVSPRRIVAILVAAGLLVGAAASAQAQTVRDHRTQPTVRDHRKPLFCFAGPFDSGSGTCFRTPYTPR